MSENRIQNSSNDFYVYTSESKGSDENGDGSCQNPFKTPFHALKKNENHENLVIMVDGSENSHDFEIISKSQMKKLKNRLMAEEKSAQNISKLEQEKAIQREKILLEAKNINITEDVSLEPAIKTKIHECTPFRNKRIEVNGWIHRMRCQGKNLMFIVLRDGTGFLQVVLSNNQCKTLDAVLLGTEATISVKGILKEIPAGQTAPGNHELICDYWQIIGHSTPGGLESVINEDSAVDTLLNHRHLTLRTDTHIKILKIRSKLLASFREHYFAHKYVEITPPTLVQTQCEGGSTLFEFDYFGEKAYLTQSSQLYLETTIPSVGDCFAISQSYRAERSLTRRHLAEYTHVEAECPFITYDDLLNRIEFLICDVVERFIKNEEEVKFLHELNKNFKAPKRPIKRMTYEEALVYLKENNIKKLEGGFYEFGDDIPEAAEREMTDKINEPIFLCKFPAELKAFYMQKCDDDRRLTESVDVLMPGVGETVGGSMRMWKYDELIEAYKKAQIDPTPYYWYTDQRKFGSCTHGGYGLGFERFLVWLTGRFHIRDALPYPRFVGRCTP